MYPQGPENVGSFWDSFSFGLNDSSIMDGGDAGGFLIVVPVN